MTATGSTPDRRAADEPLAAPDITILRGEPTPAEIAAVVAVLTEVAREVAEAAATSAKPRTGAWERNPRRLREPLHPGPGAWRGFSA